MNEKKSWQDILREKLANPTPLKERAESMVGRRFRLIFVNPFDRSGVGPGGINYVPEEEES